MYARITKVPLEYPSEYLFCHSYKGFSIVKSFNENVLNIPALRFTTETLVGFTHVLQVRKVKEKKRKREEEKEKKGEKKKRKQRK
jgi:hypothetical protein